MIFPAWAYPILFISSAYLLQCAAMEQGKRRWFFASVSALLPVLFATLRSDAVGIDVQVYVKPLSDIAQYNSPAFVFSYCMEHGLFFEPAYLLLTIVGSRIAGLPGVFFLIEAFVVIPVYFRLLDMSPFTHSRRRVDVGVAGFVYLVLFYTISLNLARQSIAMAIVFFGFKYLLDGEWRRYLAVIVAAACFHVSAFIGLAPMLVALAARGMHSMRLLCALTLAALAGVVLYGPAMHFIGSMAIGKYEAYLPDGTGYLSAWYVGFLMFMLLYAVLAALFERDSSGELVVGSKMLLTLSALGLISYLFTLYNQNNYRISLYFQLYCPLVAGWMVNSLKKEYRLAGLVAVGVPSSALWVINNIVADHYGIFPL